MESYHQTKSGWIHYIFTPGKGDTIVAIHGVGSNHTTWADAFSGLKNPKILVDIHGHGKSTSPWADVDTTAKDINSLLRKRMVRRYILVGNSLGSSIAVKLCKLSKPKKLILVGPFFGDIIRHSKVIRAVCKLMSYLPKIQRKKVFVDYSKEVGRASIMYPYLDIKGIDIPTWMAGAADCIKVNFSELPEVPTLLIYGKNDGFLFTHKLRDNHHSKCEVDSDHLVLYHKPMEVNKAIKAFI